MYFGTGLGVERRGNGPLLQHSVSAYGEGVGSYHVIAEN